MMNPTRHKSRAWVTAAAAFLLLHGCERGPALVEYGKQECAECSMTLVDKRHGAQYVTGKGKVFTFDDINCFVEFIHREPAASDPKPLYYVIDFNKPGEWIDATRATYLKHEKLRSPMRADVAALPDSPSALALQKELGEGGKLLDWGEIKVMFQPKP